MTLMISNIKQTINYWGKITDKQSRFSINHDTPVIVMSKMLGHVKPSITLDVYGHLLPNMQIEAAVKIDVLITPVAVQQVAPGCTRLHPEEALP
jgi:hypothetical protein